MAGEIQHAHYATARTLYALVRNSTGAVWNASSFVTYVTANLGDYDVAMTEQGTASRFYAGTFPTVAAGIYSVAVYDRAGGSPAEGDTLVASGDLHWTGSIVMARGTLNDDAITAAKIAAGAIDAATFAADVDAEILSYLVDDATRIDASALNTATVTTIPAILVDTGTTLDGKVDSILEDTGTTLDGRISSILEDTGAVLPAAIADLPTVAEFEARTIAAASYATAANLATVAGYLDTEIAAILADTNELQVDWANGGRLDVILDARASQASVDDVPTVAEFEARTIVSASYATPTNITAGTITNLTNLPTIPANWLTATGTAADFTTEIQAGLATAAALATTDGKVDAIKAKTDNLPSDPADQSLIIAATNAVIADTEDIQSRLPAALTGDGNIKADALKIAGAAPNDPSAATIAAAVLAAGDVDGFSLEETLKLCLAALAGKLSGAATAEITIRAADDSASRIVASVDTSGNRTAVTLDAN